MSEYTPNYDPDDIDDLLEERNLSGLSPKDNVFIEEHNQASVADEWKIACEWLNNGDSQPMLETLGFIINGESELFYDVTPPDGWTKSTDGYWTEIRDETGTLRARQFFKGAWYDSSAFVSFEVTA